MNNRPSLIHSEYGGLIEVGAWDIMVVNNRAAVIKDPMASDSNSKPSHVRSLKDLVGLVLDLDPFLAETGIAYCHIPRSDRATSALFELKSVVTRDVIQYKYREHRGGLPARGLVDQAISVVHERLWWERQFEKCDLHCVTRLIVKAGESRDGFVGSE